MRVAIDTDAGVDDALAIVYASRLPDVSIELITTVSGNVPVKEVTQNVLLLKEMLALDVPVHSGARVPRSRKLTTAPEVHGQDGVGGYRTSGNISFPDWETGDAALAIVRSARKFAKHLTIISLGPMTNIANAVAIDAATMRKVGRIVQMGGVFSGYGNTTEFTEFNIFVDPEAAGFVLNSGVKVDFVPLDLTETLVLPGDLFDTLIADADRLPIDLARLIRKSLSYYVRYHRRTEKLDGCYLHDPISVAAAVHPEWFRFVNSLVSVETAGVLTAGMTISDFRKKTSDANSRIAVGFNGVEFFHDLTQRVFGVKFAAALVRAKCLKNRFAPDFRNSLR